MRLIDSDALHDCIMDNDIHRGIIYVKNVYKIIDDCPAIDAVPVVRCKDCIYYEKGIDYPPYCNCPSGGISDYPQEDDFCSHGERGEEE